MRVLQPLSAGVERMPLVYEPDPELGYRYRPLARGRMLRNFEIDVPVAINSRGFHDVEPREEPADLRIAVIGDSFTAALHVPVEEGWTRQLEAELRAAGRRVRVANLGLDGSGPEQHLVLLRRHGARLRPQGVVVAFTANDANDLERGVLQRRIVRGHLLIFRDESEVPALTARVDRALEARAERWLHERSYLFRMATFSARGPDNPLRTNVVVHEGGPAPASRALAEVLGDLQRLAAELGARLVVVPIPQKSGPDRSARVLRRHVAPGEVDVLDPLPTLIALLAADGVPWNALFWRHDAHFDPDGHRWFARALAHAWRGRGAAGP